MRDFSPYVLALLLVLTGPSAFAQMTAADSSSADQAWLGAADAARTYGAGPDGALDPALPTIHEFVDFACPSCREAFETKLDSVKAAFVATGRANLVVRAFPIPRLMRGMHATEAAFCAGAIGGRDGFEFVQRRLYLTQPDWRFLRDPTPAFRQAAADAGLDAAAFDECLARDATAPLLTADTRLGASLGAGGTPTFVFVAPEATEAADLFYGSEPMTRFEEAFARTLAHTDSETESE
ncbi:MAG: thioredoxin domain-containing protein [Bacteroidota bacterium]